MPSKLINLKATLSLDDFQGTPPPNTPWLAETRVDFPITFDGNRTPQFETADGGFRLKDQVIITITFDKKKSWKQDLSNLNLTQERFLRDHEQGHYDLAALVARDLFIALMQLKSKTYPHQQAGTNEVNTLINTYRSNWSKIDALYDSDTNHGAWRNQTLGPPVKSTDQTKWEGLFQKAFTTQRTPYMEAPDGAAYKVEIVDVIRQAGFTI
jgi:hypothetical protein